MSQEQAEQALPIDIGDNQEPKQAGDDNAKRRIRSTIEFPYLDLDEAVGVARGLHSAGGNCQFDQLAGQLSQSASSSMFSVRLNTARMFGFITYSQQTAALTPLGNRVCDPQQEQAARVEAFLTVPLYKAVYEKYKGVLLPPPGGLEAAMATLGVAEKQKGKARQVFQRAASQAGFFTYGSNRLVPPAVKGGSGEIAAAGASENQQEPESKKRSNGGGNGGDGSQHPLIEGLIKALPAAESPWPIEKRRRWLQAAANNFDLIYTDANDDGDSLKIEILKGSAK